MKLGDHEIEPIPFPGNEHGYLPGSSGKPGDLCGFFPPGIQVYQCIRCKEMFQPVGEDGYSVPDDPETADHIRVSFGGTSRHTIETHPNWVCEENP